jgi:hypothetical protein
LPKNLFLHSSIRQKENFIFAVVMNELNSFLAFTNTQNSDYYNSVIFNFVFEYEKPLISSSYEYEENIARQEQKKGFTGIRTA